MYVMALAAIYGVFSVFAAQAVQQYAGVEIPWQLFVAVTLPIMGFLSYLRIPLKPATDSETKPAICSDFIPASIPI